MTRRRTTWGKAEKLKSRKHIERVFREGKSFPVFPYKVVYLVAPALPVAPAPSTPSAATPALPTASSPRNKNPQRAAPGPRSKDAQRTASGPRSKNPRHATSGPRSKNPRHATPGPRSKAPQHAAHAPLQAGFGASSRSFKKAVDRNRIKRLGREAYRLQKAPLLEQLTRKGLSMAVFFIFIGKQLPDYPTVNARIGVALQKLLKETA